MLNATIRALVPIVAVLACQAALAFGPNGHMAVGTIADSLIAGSNAGRQVRKILGTNLRTASVWADCAKGVSEKTFKYGGAGHYPECQVYENPGSEKQMEAFVKRNVGNCTSPHNTEACHKQYHYTDVALQRTRYEKGRVGTTDQDIVSAISACIAVLQDQPSPAPFNIASKKEALRLLTHYLGDIHQPLHVAAVYLDAGGNIVDPDKGTFDPNTETRGGNDLLTGGKKLHALWDDVLVSLTQTPPSKALLTQAAAVPVTAGAMENWSTAWATESIAAGKKAFDGLAYAAEDSAHHYQVTLPTGYQRMKNDIQREQIAKAGARLAQVLQQIWP